MKFERDYKRLLNRIINTGGQVKTRTGVPAFKLFNQTLNVNTSMDFPILTGKQIFFNKIVGEFLWMYYGSNDLSKLHEYGITWWDEYADEDGNLGRMYGYQFRNFNGVHDQIEYAIKEIKNNTRRAVISLWNPSDLEHQALPPCFTELIFSRDRIYLDLAITFRSSDVFLGLPYDIGVMALILDQVAKDVNLQPRMLGLNLVDAHVYKNHTQAAAKYLRRDIFQPPRLAYRKPYELVGYVHGPFIKAKLNI